MSAAVTAVSLGNPLARSRRERSVGRQCGYVVIEATLGDRLRRAHQREPVVGMHRPDAFDVVLDGRGQHSGRETGGQPPRPQHLRDVQVDVRDLRRSSPSCWRPRTIAAQAERRLLDAHARIARVRVPSHRCSRPDRARAPRGTSARRAKRMTAPAARRWRAPSGRRAGASRPCGFHRRFRPTRSAPSSRPLRARGRARSRRRWRRGSHRSGRGGSSTRAFW